MRFVDGGCGRRMPNVSWVSLPIAPPGLISVSPQIRAATMLNTRLIPAARPPRATGMSNSARPSAIAAPPHSANPIQNHDSGISIDSALPPGVLRAPAEPWLAIDSALPPGVLRAPAEPWLAIDSALPPEVLRAPAEPWLAIDSVL